MRNIGQVQMWNSEPHAGHADTTAAPTSRRPGQPGRTGTRYTRTPLARADRPYLCAFTEEHREAHDRT
jgi:hypothetical protein